ncbi:hypothetical protein [Leptospira santarosai]|uniref:Uncharacterized protein n=1 Tax=Leptospira santarosai serovar Shermani str. LT 821 TaxID=758847 RepID=K8Y8A7_9LEPT|nr:hypothetical protein [Leptospira santarosai]EKT85960.1 hypothetical protein LSS_15131 [Leptospira santarosai serovar Shermani str. LT 821]EPG82199.1 hypothetical protein LEP1GSC048_0660 [Leptospira santarosai serovar Shermani str. 1342KT]
MANNETTNEEGKSKRGNGKGERVEKPVREKPAPYIINSESEKETALLEIQSMMERLDNDAEAKAWQAELDSINKRAIELKSLINERKKSASSEKKDMSEKIVVMKAGIADYEVNKSLGKIA